MYRTVNDMLKAAAAGTGIPESEVKRLAYPLEMFSPGHGMPQAEVDAYWTLAKRAQAYARPAASYKPSPQQPVTSARGSTGEQWQDEES